MSQYLQRLNISSVEEVGVDNNVLPQYQQIVTVVEVVDQAGNPWQPVPLEIAPNQGSNWVGSNVYEVGKTVEAKTAAYTGGVEPVTYRCRFQFKPIGADWVNGPWQDTVNAKTSFFFSIVEEGES